MPCDWSNNSQWSFGEALDLVGPYWQIPEHNNLHQMMTPGLRHDGR